MNQNEKIIENMRQATMQAEYWRRVVSTIRRYDEMYKRFEKVRKRKMKKNTNSAE